MSAGEAIVLAGGFGTRLRSVVSAVPKPLAPVRGRPFLAWLLDRLARDGISRVVLATGYMASTVENAIGRDWHGMRVDYSVEREPLGTGGAIAQALSMIDGRRAHVLNGDTYLDYAMPDFAKVVDDSGCSIGIALALVTDAHRYGAVSVQHGRVVGFQEKGHHGPGMINAGSYFLTERAIENFPKEASFSFEKHVLTKSADRRDICAFIETSSFIDIGIPEDYARAVAVIPRLSGE